MFIGYSRNYVVQSHNTYLMVTTLVITVENAEDIEALKHKCLFEG